MHHILYKVSTNSNMYYIGRHSTNDINDSYFGSGKWPTSLIKSGKLMCKEVLCEVDNLEELIELEDLVIKTCINEEHCMNFNENAVGFSSINNPSKSERRRKEISENGWFKSEECKKFLTENNPSTYPEVKIKRRNKSLEQLSNGTHNFLNKDLQEINISRFKKMLVENNPNNKESNKKGH